MPTERTYEVVDRGWSEHHGAPLFEVRCRETGEVVYETDEGWAADLMCERWNTGEMP